MEEINHPKRYNQSDIECIDAISEIISDFKGETAFDIGNFIKYIWRANEKGGKEDLEKAKWYIERAFGKHRKNTM